MIINCDLELSEVQIESDSNEESSRLFSNIILTLLKKSNICSLKDLSNSFDIEILGLFIKIRLVNNNFYQFSILQILSAVFAIEEPETLILEGHDPRTHDAIILNDLAKLIVHCASSNIQFKLSDRDGWLFPGFEPLLLKQLSLPSSDSERFDRVLKYLSLDQVEGSSALSQKIQALALKEKYGDKAERSAKIIQSFFRNHLSHRKEDSLVLSIKNALDERRFEDANSIMQQLFELKYTNNSLSKSDADCTPP